MNAVKFCKELFNKISINRDECIFFWRIAFISFPVDRLFAKGCLLFLYHSNMIYPQSHAVQRMVNISDGGGAYFVL